MLVVCERRVGDWDRLLFWPKVLLSTIAALLSHLDWGCSTVGHWGPKALRLPLALNSPSCPQLQLTQAICVLVIFLFDAHLLPLFFCLFTQVHLLIDSSVESQYVTLLLGTPTKEYQQKQAFFFLISYILVLIHAWVPTIK